MLPSAARAPETHGRQQCADAVLMVRPQAFGYNPETALTNTFRRPHSRQMAMPARRPGRSSSSWRGRSRAKGQVCLVEDTEHPVKPDALFPNNWVSFHEDGTLVLYPLQTVSRRFERRPEVIETAVRELGFRVSHLLDLSWFEVEGKYLEGTGSLVLDNIARVAYACVSPRTHPEVLHEWTQALGYEAVTFSAADRAGVPLYHTNVLMCIGARAVVVGTESIVPADRARVLERLAGNGREIIEIGHDEIHGSRAICSSWEPGTRRSGTRAYW